ncbi:MAG TPA: M48 family metallopeptidase [Methylomirabilota bacterium]|jgi:predicted Zn-dependent protease
MRFLTILIAAALAAGCAVQASGQADRRQPQPAPQPTASQPTASSKKVDPAVVERLQRVMIPLMAKMNKPLSPNQVKVGIMDDPHINAASAGGGEFYVTTGLLEKANDDQMRGVLAHELAHEDLGHVAKAQRLGAGLQIGAVLLDQIIPGSGAVTPIAGQLIARSYSRKEEYEADRHGAEILQRAGYSKDVMINTLTWLNETEGASGGGFFATHPATGDRIEALKKG